jgi:hypothetical protein
MRGNWSFFSRKGFMGDEQGEGRQAQTLIGNKARAAVSLRKRS